MPAGIQHTLLHLEFPPPPEAWQAVEQWLDTEYDADETRVGQHVYDIAVSPPSNAWQEIFKELQTKAEPKAPAILPFRKIAIAASVIGLAGLLSWYFFHNTPEGNKLIIPSASAAAAVGLNKDNSTVPPTASNNLPKRREQHHRPSNSNKLNISTLAYNPNDLDNENTEASNIQYASLGNLRAVNPVPSPIITAPPIRDANGKIILDPGVLAPYNDCYITVTGPNGEQTRISSKFLEVLNALNPDTQPQEYFDMIIRNNSLWKKRFNEWRNKLSQQSSFIPDMTNFFDIVSLGDLIGDGNQK